MLSRSWCSWLTIAKKVCTSMSLGLPASRMSCSPCVSAWPSSSFTSNSGMCTVPGIAPFISISKDWRMSIIAPRPRRQSSVAAPRLISRSSGRSESATVATAVMAILLAVSARQRILARPGGPLRRQSSRQRMTFIVFVAPPRCRRPRSWRRSAGEAKPSQANPPVPITHAKDPAPMSAGRSDEQADVGLAGELQEGGCAAVVDAVDELAGLEVEQVDRHLAGDELDAGFEAQRTQLLERRAEI